jgi:hypothetical protein
MKNILVLVALGSHRCAGTASGLQCPPRNSRAVHHSQRVHPMRRGTDVEPRMELNNNLNPDFWGERYPS